MFNIVLLFKIGINFTIMAKDNDDNVHKRLDESNTNEFDTSLVSKFRSHVTGLFSNTSIKRWFGRDGTTRNARSQSDDAEDDEEEERLGGQPPAKRLRSSTNHVVHTWTSYQNTFNNGDIPTSNQSDTFTEPVAGPSGVKYRKVEGKERQPDVGADEKNSDSEESTSGYSSTARVESKEKIGESDENVVGSKSSLDTSSFTHHRSLFNSTPEEKNRSLFNRTQSKSAHTSLSSRRPNFDASTFASPNFVDRTLTTRRILNSPFYTGNTTFGGASSLARRFGAGPSSSSSSSSSTVRNAVAVKPTNQKSISENTTLSKTARRILTALEQYSTPISEAKKIPLTTRAGSSGILTKYIGANPYVLRNPEKKKAISSTTELQIPTVPELLRMKQKEHLQDSTVSVRQLAATSKSSLNREEYRLRTDDVKGKGKSLKARSTVCGSVRQKAKCVDDDNAPLVVPDLPSIPLPITVLPKFDLGMMPILSKPTEKSESVLQKEMVKNDNETNYKFVQPIVVAKKSVNNLQEVTDKFVFSKPVVKDPSCKSSGTNDKSPNKMQNIPKMTLKPFLTDTVKQSSNSSTSTATNSKTTTNIVKFDDKFKPAANTWECSTCLVRNSDNLTKCSCCETVKPSTSWGDKFKMSNDKWECTVCMVRNTNDLVNCAACSTPKSSESKNDKDKCTSTLQTNSSSSSGSKLQSSTVSIGFGDKFKPPNNSWECSACMLMNRNDSNKCIACETAKPNSDASASGVENSWLCPACKVRNGLTSSKCVLCDRLKSDVSATIPDKQMDSNKENAFSPFNFGIAKSDAKFSFGIPAQKSTSSSTTTPTSSVSTIFGGVPSTVTPTTSFTFGIKPDATAQKASVETSEKVETHTNPLLKPNEKLPEKVEPIVTDGFKFSAPKTTTITPTKTPTKVPESNLFSSPPFQEKTTPNKSLTPNGDIQHKSPATTLSLPSTLVFQAKNNDTKSTNIFANTATFKFESNGDVQQKTSTGVSFQASPNFAFEPKNNETKTSIVSTTVPSFNFVSKVTTTTASTESNSSTTTVSTAPPNIFAFGAKPAEIKNGPTNIPVFGQLPTKTIAETKPFTFGDNVQSPKTSTFTFGSPPEKMTNFKFGSDSTPTLNFGSNAAATNPAPVFSFGAKPDGQLAPFSSGNGIFGAAAATAGAPTQPPSAKNGTSFNFGPMSSNNNQKAGFSFGSQTASTSGGLASGGFNFGAATKSESSSGFNFNANATPSFNFTDGSATPVASQPGDVPHRKIRRALRRTQR